jgi:hypothetical protein
MRHVPLILLICAGALVAGCASTPPKTKETKHQLYLEAEQHYHRGIDAYTNSRYAEAIRQWQLTLDYEPGYPNVHQYIARAQRAERSITALSSAADPLSFSAVALTSTVTPALH